ncbi:MAG: hypothetical protein AAGH71_01680 [Planctomycetota bacterium]
MPKQATRSKPRATSDPAETITESKLSRVETIAREALDILGTDAPEDLRRSAADERAEHEARLAAIEGRRKELEDELTKAGERAAELERAVTAAERLAEERHAEAEEVWELARQHADESASATAKIESLENDLALTRVTADSRARAHDEVLAELKQAGETLQAAQSTEAELRGALAAISEARDTVTEELETLRAEQGRFADEIASLREQHADALRSIEADLAHASTTAEAEKVRAAALGDDLTEARSELEAATTELGEAVDRIATIQGDLTTARNEIAQRSASQRDAEERLQRAREAHAELETELEDARQYLEQCERARAELHQSRQEMADLTTKLAERDRTIVELTSETTDRAGSGPAESAYPAAASIAPQGNESALSEMEAELEARSTELAYTREQLDRADARATRYRDRAEQAKQELEKAKAIVRRARRRAARRTDSFAGTIQALTGYRERCSHLERECLTLQENARIRTIWAVAAGGLALIGILSAAVF